MALVNQLQADSSNSVTTDSELLSATWRLLWTTEKETQFILKNAGLFGTCAGDVYQVLNAASHCNIPSKLP